MLKIEIEGLEQGANTVNTVNIVEESNYKDIAIIGISVRLPMADSLNEFWNILSDGKCCVTELPTSRKQEVDKFMRLRRVDPTKIKYKKGSYIEGINEFDYKYFNISPREASLIDPNQRIFLQTVIHTFEDAGYSIESLRGKRTGIFYGFVSDLAYQRFISEVEPLSIGISIPGNMASIIPGRVSYILDLKGPSVMIDTACSSSLVAVHTACNAIRNGDCDTAIVGSGKLNLLPIEDNNMLGIESKDYTCKAFDDSSEGTCMGEGFMAIMLKPLSRAIKDNDNIYAVIKGSAINQDGASMGLTAPNSDAQQDVIDRAWEEAAIAPETITYIETHGTGTKLGDPIEVAGITKAFNKHTARRQFCGIGSVKTNLGHLDSAAGLLGLIKAVLSLKHKMLPPSINFKFPNRNIEFEKSPVYVNHRLVKWHRNNSPRRCGISAFGLSGTNCHVILEEFNKIKTTLNTNDIEYILAISAKSKEALINLVKKYYNKLKEGFYDTLGDLCYTANTGRGHYDVRLIMVVKDLNDLENKIRFIINSGDLLRNGEGIFYGEINQLDNKKVEASNTIRLDNKKKSLKLLADELVKGYKCCIKQSKESISILEKLCRLYVKGADINWQELYLEGIYNRISLPGYPFKKRRCWIDVPEVSYNEDAKDKEHYNINKNKPQVVLIGRENNVYTTTEKCVAQAWGEVLGIEEIDISKDLYYMGGDSIIALNIANDLSSRLGQEITVSDIIRSLTVKDFSRLFDEEVMKKIGLELATFQHKPSDNQGKSEIEYSNTRGLKYVPLNEVNLSEQMKENLKKYYFYESNGNANDFIMSLECLAQLVYIFVRDTYGASMNVKGYFVENLSPKMEIDDDGNIYELHTELLNTMFNVPGVSYNVFEGGGNGMQSIIQLEELLDKGYFVIVQAITHRIPYSNSFVAFDFDIKSYELTHSFLVVGHDDKRLFYVESPLTLNDSYKYIEGNKGIGVIDKKDMEPAFDLVRFITLYPEPVKNNQACNSVMNVINESIKSYYKPPAVNEDNLKVLYGIDVLDYFIHLCDKENIHLDENARKNYLQTQYNYLFWKMNIILFSKKVLVYALEEMVSENQQDLMDIIESINMCKNAWKRTIAFMNDRYAKKEFILDSKYTPLFLDIKVKELEMIEKLRTIRQTMFHLSS